MSRFAKIEEPAINRHDELTGEELRLYCLIKFHTWNETNICKKTLHEIAEIHGLNYDHTTARYKSLRTKGWCEKTKKGIRSIVSLKTSKTEVSDTSKSEVVNHKKLQKRKFQTSKTEVIEPEKLQNPKFPFIPYKESFKDEPSSDQNNNENPVVVTSSSGEKNLSNFSIEECLRYVEIRIERGEKLETPHRLAKWLHQTGEMDAFIEAILYPSEQSVTTSLPVEYADDEFFDELPPAEPLSDDERESSLVLLRSMLRESSLGNLETFSVNFTRDDWAWLKGELQNAG